MKRNQNFLLLLVIIAATATSCSSGVKTHASTTKGVKLNEYKTYAWVEPRESDDPRGRGNRMYAEFIMQLSNTELANKGFTIDANQPDAVFVVDTKVEDIVSYSQSPQMMMGMGFGGPFMMGGFAAPVGGGRITQNFHREGMLMVSMYDTRSQELLWQGWAKSEITDVTNVDSVIRKGVSNLFMRMSVRRR